MQSPAVEMHGISKQFPGVLANDEVDFSACQGELHTLVGENGAGKTTLMNILYGLHRPDSGEIRVFGQATGISSPRDAIALGIGMVHQHFMLVQAFTGLENIILGREPTSMLRTDYRTAEKRLRETCDRFGLQVDLRAHVADLSVSAQQKVEILKALYREARILILDEPTSVLAPQEAESLFTMLRRLVEEGMCIIQISHKLGEVMEYSDRVTVLRQGRSVAYLETGKTTPEELARLMVGSETATTQEIPSRPSTGKGPPILSVRDLSVIGDRGILAVDGLSFDLHADEILGVAGVDGNGQLELADALIGLTAASGSVLLDGTEIARIPVRRRLEAGIAYIPEDRRFALVADNSIEENAILGSHRRPPISHLGVLDPGAGSTLASRLIEGFDIRAFGPEMVTRLLSGGNQQKLVLGRALDQHPRALIACQPTRGLDVNATAEVHRRLIEARDSGAGILLISHDLDELLALSDRVMVMFRGRIAGILDREHANRENVGALMLGTACCPP